jgi:ABC-type branched-subunit amino acid transport system ATPase component/MFS family permease
VSTARGGAAGDGADVAGVGNIIASTPASWPRRMAEAVASYAALRKTRYGIAPSLVLSLLIFLQVFDDQFFAIATPNIIRDLHASIQAVAGIYQMVGILSVLLTLAVAYYADHGRRVLLVFGTSLLSGLSAMVIGAARSVPLVAIPKALDTASSQASSAPSQSLIADYYPLEYRARAYALLSAFPAIAAVASPVLGLSIVLWGWRATSIGLGVPLLLVGVVVLVVLREPTRGYFERRASGQSEEVAATEDEPLSFSEAWRTVWAGRTLRRIFFANAFQVGGAYGMAVLMGLYLADVYGLNAFQRGLFVVPQVLALILGTVVGGGVLDAVAGGGPRPGLLHGAVGTARSGVGVAVIGLGLPLPLLVASTVVIGFATGAVSPANTSVLSEVMPARARTVAFGVLPLSQVPATLVVLPVVFAVQAAAGYEAAIAFAAPLLFIGALLQASAADYFPVDRRNALLASGAAEEYRETVAADRAKLLVSRGVEVHYGGNQVLFGVDFDVDQGEIIALLGTNGAGKSTLLRAISGTQEASGGAIIFDGREITHMPPHEVAALGVIHMPGGRGTFPGLTVRENLALGTWLAGTPAEARAGLERVYQLFPVLRERGGELATSLSGGEQQMLSLAQAFLAKPRLLMIDELSLGLSPAVVAQLLKIVEEIHSRGTTIIVVEQSVNVALTIAQRAMFMEKGEVKFFGETSELLRRPDILRAVYVKGTGGAIGGGGSPAPARHRAEAGTAPPVLEVRGISRSFGGVRALDDVSLTLQAGQVLGLIGPNGSGKTTLFDIISGYQSPDAGAVVFEGVDITSMSPEERARRRLVRRFQDARLFPSLTVFETLLIALDQRLEVRNPFFSALGLPQARRAERRLRAQADRLIELLELGAFRDKFVRELSTGLRRVVDLATVLAADPRVLLLDEPSSGIAQSESEGLAPLLRRVRYETGCSILLIEHDMPLITRVADELVMLERGSVLLQGDADTVLNDQRVIEAYLGGSEAAVHRSGSLV